MHWFTLIARPGRAAALVATVGLLFAGQSLLALGGVASAGYGTLAALAAAIVAIGVFAPLHSRSGAIAVVTARVGLALALVPVAGSLATGWSIWLPVLVITLAVAAGGMAWLVLARRHEGDIPGRLLELALAGTVVGALFAPVGGCILPGILWLAVAAALWSSYAAPGFSLAAVTGSVDPLATGVALGTLDVVLVGVDGRVEAVEDLALARQLAALDVPLRIPEIRPDERLRAVREDLVDLDQQPELRRLALDRQGLEQRRVGRQRRAPVDAERVADAGDEKQQPDVRVRRGRCGASRRACCPAAPGRAASSRRGCGRSRPDRRAGSRRRCRPWRTLRAA